MLDAVAEFAAAWGPDLVVADDTWSEEAGLYAKYGLGRLDLGQIDCLVNSCPDELCRRGTGHRRLPVRYQPYNGDGFFPAWLARRVERERICVAWQAAESDSGALSLSDLVDGLVRDDVEVVVLPPPADGPCPCGCPAVPG